MGSGRLSQGILVDAFCSFIIDLGDISEAGLENLRSLDGQQ